MKKNEKMEEEPKPKKSKKVKEDPESESEEEEKKYTKEEKKAMPKKVPSDYNCFMKIFGAEIVAKEGEVDNSKRFTLISEAFKVITEAQ
jgi:hypothetical protein